MMKIKRFGFKITAWKAAMVLSVCACVLMTGMLWFSGVQDADEAYETGRRLLIARADGKVDGKINTTIVKPPEVIVTPGSEAPEEPKPEEEMPEEVTLEGASEENEENIADEEPANETTSEQEANESAKPSALVPGEELPMSYKPEEVLPPDESVTIVPSDNPLPLANDKLLEEGEFGKIPSIAGDGTKSWTYYARPFERSGSDPMITIIITGLGHGKYVTEKALVLPEAFTLSFSPYAKNVASWANTARLTAHEKLIDLPLQPTDYPASDPGPYGLILDKGHEENLRRLKWLMSRFSGFVGFVAPQNESYTNNDESLKVLLQALANRGVMLVMGREPAKTDIKAILETSSTPNVIADMLVDEELLDSSIDTRLAGLEQLAKKRGHAIGIVRATPLVMERLKIWAETLEEKGILLAPVSAVAKLRFSS